MEMTMTNDPSRPSRREFAAAAALAAAGLSAMNTAAGAQTKPAAGGQAGPAPNMDSLPTLKAGLLLFPQLTAMDLVAPQLCMRLMMKTDTHIVAETMAPVMTGEGYEIVPTMTFADCPKDLDVLLVPGGPRGTELAVRNDKLLDFVADRGSRARYVTSVCTGSVILGAAGLLKGYRAGSHWMTLDMLSMFGAIPVDERVVIDRNRMTGGGITAGLDFGLQLVTMLRGEETARLAQLFIEYAPQPPYDSGSMKTARPATIALARKLSMSRVQGVRDAAEAARVRRSI
jgi:cyclohexyl-isocyanide hydratase